MRNPLSALTQINTVSQNNMTFNVYVGNTDEYLFIECENLRKEYGDTYSQCLSDDFDANDKMVLATLASDETAYSWMRLGDESIDFYVNQVVSDLQEFMAKEERIIC
jgi:hypothetical protein